MIMAAGLAISLCGHRRGQAAVLPGADGTLPDADVAGAAVR
jgi:hypothetical protein